MGALVTTLRGDVAEAGHKELARPHGVLDKAGGRGQQPGLGLGPAMK